MPLPSARRPKLVGLFTGDIEGVLQRADELETAVRFQVAQFVITRMHRGQGANPKDQPAGEKP